MGNRVDFGSVVLNYGRKNNKMQPISFAGGLVVPIATLGVIAEIKLPLVILVDLSFRIFIWRLVSRYQTELVEGAI